MNIFLRTIIIPALIGIGFAKIIKDPATGMLVALLVNVIIQIILIVRDTGGIK